VDSAQSLCPGNLRLTRAISANMRCGVPIDHAAILQKREGQGLGVQPAPGCHLEGTVAPARGVQQDQSVSGPGSWTMVISLIAGKAWASGW
jgi:hypothetical protein